MQRLLLEFFGYLRLYQSRLLPVLLLGLLLGVIFLFLIKKGYTKYEERPFGTILCGLFLSLSIAVVIVMTLYGRTPGNEFVFRFQLFGSYVEAFRDNNVEVLLQIIMNVIMFVPIGLLLPCCFETFEKNRRVLGTMLLFSGGIELIQGIARIGMFEFDDILGNVLGAEIGFLLYFLLRRFRKQGNYFVSYHM